uniref:EED-1 n=1 Tax=Schmidtea mediterranea TaxID=79327 RepID=H9CXT3_SCHMD|nr:EED-1 [Schmidtea mediterranea]
MFKEETKLDAKRKLIKAKRKGPLHLEIDKESVSNSSKSLSDSILNSSQLNFKQTALIKESHNNSIFGISVNDRIRKNKSDPILFVSVGGQNVTFYECLLDTPINNIKFLHAYKDSDPNEEFYCCAWSYYVPFQNRNENYRDGMFESYLESCTVGQQIVACAGKKGIIRIISPNMSGVIFNLGGHGQSINEIIFHPLYPDLLFSFSKDYTIRLWNVWNSVLVCIFGGSEGHRSEILHGDVDMAGRFLLSCGMDHTIKIWKLDDSRLMNSIAKSRKYLHHENEMVFDTFLQHFPDFSSNKIHGNYIDCGRWFGGLVFSKSCEGYLVLWKPGSLNSSLLPTFKIGQDVKPSILHQFELDDCDIWYVRFDIDVKRGLLALGNRLGHIYVWNLRDRKITEGNSIFDLKPQKFMINSKNGLPVTIRQTRFTDDAKILLCACDGGLIARFDRT